MTQKILFILVLALLAARPAAADLGVPAYMSLVQVTMKDGSVMKGVTTVAPGGYEPDKEPPVMIVMKMKNGTERAIKIDPHMKQQSINLAEPGVEDISLKLYESRRYITVERPRACDTYNIQKASLADVKSIVLEYQKTRDEHDALVQQYNVRDKYEACPRYFDCSGSEDCSCMGFMMTPPADILFARKIMENLVAATWDSYLLNEMNDADIPPELSDDMKQALGLLKTWKTLSPDARYGMIDKINGVYERLSKTYGVVTEGYVYSAEQSILPSDTPPQ